MYARRTAAAVVASLVALRAQAQVVRGIVVDRAEQPVAGVVVALLDAESAIAARALTNDRGEYRLSATSAGTYRVRTLRIGFHPTVSPPIVLAIGQDVTERLVLTGLAFALDTVRVSDHASCRLARDSAAATFAVWEQARAALTAAELTASARALNATIVAYDRTLDRDFRGVREQTASVSKGYVSQPWRTRPPDSLHVRGYVVDDAAGFTTYYAPGLDMLLASAFVEDHCFRLTRAGDASLVGIAFEPTPDRKALAEIAGTLWLDRATSELRRLEYRYANLPPAQTAHAGGEMTFIRMRNGGWAVTRWQIRMPAFASFLLPSGRRESRVSEIHVTGGELALALHGRDTLFARPPITLAGTVTDSASGAPAVGARLALLGTSARAVTDASGRFALADVLPGTYELEVRTPSLDTLGAVHRAPVAIADSTSTVAIRVPTGPQVAASVCRGAPARMPGDDGIVLGFVYVRGDPVARPNVTVVAEWTEATPRAAGETAVDHRPRWVETRSDASGAFRLCGVSRSAPLVVRASADTVGAARADVRFAAADRVARLSLTLDPQIVASATFIGTVFVDSVRTPIAGAEVAFPTLGRSTLTNERGAFGLADVPAGTHHVLVRRLGYGPLDVSLEFRANRTLERTIYLSRVRTLDSVIVSEQRDPALDEFEANRKLGLGAFMTRAELQRVNGRPMAEVFRQFRGADVIMGTGNKAWIASRRGPKKFACTPPPRENASKLDLSPCDVCYPQVYMDEVLLSRDEVPDMNRFTPDELEGIEFYAGAAQTPARYSDLGTNCGVIVLHARRTP